MAAAVHACFLGERHGCGLAVAIGHGCGLAIATRQAHGCGLVLRPEGKQCKPTAAAWCLACEWKATAAAWCFARKAVAAAWHSLQRKATAAAWCFTRKTMAAACCLARESPVYLYVYTYFDLFSYIYMNI